MEIAGRNWPFDAQQQHDVTFFDGEFVLHHVEGGQTAGTCSSQPTLAGSGGSVWSRRSGRH
jgi:hypothetical protein